MKISYTNFKKEFPAVRDDRCSFQRWFYFERMWKGKIIHIGIKHHRITIDLRLVMLLRCWLLDRHEIAADTIKGPYQGVGDGYDIFGICHRCGKMCSKDTHWTGDGEWYRVKEL